MARPGRGSDDGWFRLGSLDVTTVLLVSALAVVSFVVWALEPPGKPIQSALMLNPDSFIHGQVWRIITWPIAYPNGMGFFDIIAVALFWYFGTEIEHQLGRKRMAWFLGLVTVGLGLLWVGIVGGDHLQPGSVLALLAQPARADGAAGLHRRVPRLAASSSTSRAG